MLPQRPMNWHALGVRTGLTVPAIILTIVFAVIAAQVFAPTTGMSQVISDSTPEADEADESPSAPEAPGSTVLDGTPGDEAEEAVDDDVDDEPAPPSPSGASGDDPATEPGAPATLAHGLTYVTGDDIVWQVREANPDGTAAAVAVTGESSMLLQRAGSSIVRNEVTGKRALTNVGEAFFRAPGDPYTVFASGDNSTVWIMSLVEPADVADDAFYESPVVDTIEEGSYDFSLIRYVLQPGDQAALPEPGGPAVIMASSGEILVEDDAGLSLLADGQGQLLPSGGNVTNDGDDPAVYVVAQIGDSVADETASAPQDVEAEAEVPDTDEPEAPTPAPAEVAPPAEEPVDPEPDPVAAGIQTSIDVTAQADIYLTIEADGLVIFDGNLAAGNSTGVAVGSTFVVYTTSPNATLFTNACGTQFYMGETAEETTFTLEADENSCPP